jgi:hypothetical protein
MDSSLDNEISTIASLNNKFFYRHFFKDWSVSDDESVLMVAMASIVHEENGAYMLQWRSSVAGRATILDSN